MSVIPLARPKGMFARHGSKALLLFVMLISIFGLGFSLSHHIMLATNPLDFRAFYCAGAALLDGADPYLAEPLRACEVAAMRTAGLTAVPYLAIPAPLPGYALPFFMLAARMDFISASSLFGIVSLVAVGVTVVTLWKMTGLPIVTVFAALVVSDGYVGLVNGQIVPLFIMLICLAALACQLGRPSSAAICCALATIEPHLALPACISLVLFVPRARLPLVALAALLSAVSLATLGIARNVEYLMQVLPAHVASEATNAGQYSLTSLLFHVGVPPEAAIRVGEFSYGVMVVAGLAVANRLRHRPNGAAFIIFVPVAFSLLGGSFIHLVQISAAIPAALLFAARFPPHRRSAVAALALLSIPWLRLITFGAAQLGIVAAAALITLAVVWPLLREQAARFALAFATLILFTAGGLFALSTMPIKPTRDPVPAMMHVAGPDELAEATWAVYEQISQSNETALVVLAKTPTWAGLLLLLFLAMRAGLGRSATVTTGDERLRSAPQNAPRPSPTASRY